MRFVPLTRRKHYFFPSLRFSTFFCGFSEDKWILMGQRITCALCALAFRLFLLAALRSNRPTKPIPTSRHHRLGRLFLLFCFCHPRRLQVSVLQVSVLSANHRILPRLALLKHFFKFLNKKVFLSDFKQKNQHFFLGPPSGPPPGYRVGPNLLFRQSFRWPQLANERLTPCQAPCREKKDTKKSRYEKITNDKKKILDGCVSFYLPFQRSMFNKNLGSWLSIKDVHPEQNANCKTL